MEARLITKSVAVAAAVVALAWAAAPVAAFDRPPLPPANECVAACMEASRACEAPIREAAHACIEEAGCVPLIAAARAACEADRESEECESARAAARECVAPCKAEARAGVAACRSAALACLRDECGLEDLPPQCGLPPRRI